MAPRVAKSLLTLRDQVNAMAPGRDKSSDGTIGDAAHQSRKSDHNPNEDGVVTAMDITHDPAHGVDAGGLAEILRLSQDPRIKYVISNRRIFSSKVSPWQWRPYDGANAHTKHVHVSVVSDRELYDDTKPWTIEMLAKVAPPPPPSSSRRSANIIATVFGGPTDINHSAYDGHLIADEEVGVALPSRFPSGSRPKVRVVNAATGSSVVCEIVDVGPWNTKDPYWETGLRPQAESGTDLVGRKTNLAGIDLTPAAARAIGIDGKGKVDWEFAGIAPASDGKPHMDTPDDDMPDNRPSIGGLIDAIRKFLGQQNVAGLKTGETQMPTPANDIAALLEQVTKIVQTIETARKPGSSAPADQQTAQLQKVIELIGSIISPAMGGKLPLGQVNGALGETLGNLLDGKKTAIGTIGAVLTSLLSAVSALPGATGVSGEAGLAKVLALITPAAGLSQFALPIFLAMTVWGVLGKLEKWSQGNVSPTQPPK